MSDYFGALLRSAGTLAAPVSTPMPAPAAAPGGDVVEEDFEVQAGAPGEGAPDGARLAYEALAEPAPRPSAAPHADGPVHRAAIAAEPPTAPAAVPDAQPAAPPAAPLPRHEDAALAHPVVRAALRWVAADAQALPALAQAALPMQAAFPRAESSPEAVPALVPVQPLVAPFADTGHVPGLPARPRAVREVGDIDLALPATPRRHGAAEGDAAPRTVAAPARSFDLHIGTIHVAVDAPPPRVVLQPSAQPAPRQQPPAAERSGLSRSRLPRL